MTDKMDLFVIPQLRAKIRTFVKNDNAYLHKKTVLKLMSLKLLGSENLVTINGDEYVNVSDVISHNLWKRDCNLSSRKQTRRRLFLEWVKESIIFIVAMGNSNDIGKENIRPIIIWSDFENLKIGLDMIDNDKELRTDEKPFLIAREHDCLGIPTKS